MFAPNAVEQRCHLIVPPVVAAYRDASAAQAVDLVRGGTDGPWKGRLALVGRTARDVHRRAGFAQAECDALPKPLLAPVTTATLPSITLHADRKLARFTPAAGWV